jgi:hypothetical protein
MPFPQLAGNFRWHNCPAEIQEPERDESEHAMLLSSLDQNSPVYRLACYLIQTLSVEIWPRAFDDQRPSGAMSLSPN